VISIPAPVKIRVHGDQLIKEVMIISSAIRLGSGGRARLARLAKNHQVVIRGRAICRPRANIRVRLWVRS